MENKKNTQFTGTTNYVATRELQTAVNASVALQRPLLIKGEPGTGKTLLAFEVAKSLGKQLFTWHINLLLLLSKDYMSMMQFHA